MSDILTDAGNMPTEVELAKAYFEVTGYSKCWRGMEINGIKLKQSYLHEKNGTVTPLPEKGTPLIGKGTSGRIKKTDAGVVKIQKIESQEALDRALFEAAANLKLGIAKNPAIIRTNQEITAKKNRNNNTFSLLAAPNDNVKSSPLSTINSIFPCKIYQELEYLGVNLSKILAEERKKVTSHKTPPSPKQTQEQTQKELNRVIELCILVKKLHSGEAAFDGTRFAHRDIKPGNITLKNNRLHLIDTGSATNDLNDENLLTEMKFKGTALYGAIDTDNMQGLPELVVALGLNDVSKQIDSEGQPLVITNTTQDRIALLRTIWHPLDPDSKKSMAILSKATYNAMPQELQQLLDTSTILPHVDVARRTESPQFIAAVLIQYRTNNGQLTKEEIDNLRTNIDLQTTLVMKEQVRLEQITVLDDQQPSDSSSLSGETTPSSNDLTTSQSMYKASVESIRDDHKEQASEEEEDKDSFFSAPE